MSHKIQVLSYRSSYNLDQSIKVKEKGQGIKVKRSSYNLGHGLILGQTYS